MQDIIRKIVEMDEEARRLKEQAEKEKLESEKSIAETKQKFTMNLSRELRPERPKLPRLKELLLTNHGRKLSLFIKKLKKSEKSIYPEQG